MPQRLFCEPTFASYRTPSYEFERRTETRRSQDAVDVGSDARRQTRRCTVRCTPPGTATPTSGGEPSISPIGSLFAMPLFPWGWQASTLRRRGWPQRRGKVKLQRGGKAEFESWADPLPQAFVCTATPAAGQGKFGAPPQRRPLQNAHCHFHCFWDERPPERPGKQSAQNAAPRMSGGVITISSDKITRRCPSSGTQPPLQQMRAPTPQAQTNGNTQQPLSGCPQTSK